MYNSGRFSVEELLEVKEGIIENLQMYIQAEKDKQEKIKKDNENLLDFSKEMIHEFKAQ